MVPVEEAMIVFARIEPKHGCDMSNHDEPPIPSHQPADSGSFTNIMDLATTTLTIVCCYVSIVYIAKFSLLISLSIATCYGAS
jgi:hypothetical protein